MFLKVAADLPRVDGIRAVPTNINDMTAPQHVGEQPTHWKAE
jgi:hypothetical protein